MIVNDVHDFTWEHGFFFQFFRVVIQYISIYNGNKIKRKKSKRKK